MIFQHTYEWITQPSPHTGQLKTQTRRLVLDNWDNQQVREVAQYADGRIAWVSRQDCRGAKERRMLRWLVGRDYAVQINRGVAAITRIRILEIRREDVRHISEADARAEGYASPLGFLFTWTHMHDPDGYHLLRESTQLDRWRDAGAWKQLIFNRPHARYQAWVLTFEVVR